MAAATCPTFCVAKDRGIEVAPRTSCADQQCVHFFRALKFLEEVPKNLVSTATTNEEKAARLITTMKAAFPEPLVPSEAF